MKADALTLADRWRRAEIAAARRELEEADRAARAVAREASGDRERPAEQQRSAA